MRTKAQKSKLERMIIMYEANVYGMDLEDAERYNQGLLEQMELADRMIEKLWQKISDSEYDSFFSSKVWQEESQKECSKWYEQIWELDHLKDHLADQMI